MSENIGTNKNRIKTHINIYSRRLHQTPRSDYFPWQYIISLPPARFLAQIQADSFFLIFFFLDLIPQNIVSFL